MFKSIDPNQKKFLVSSQDTLEYSSEEDYFTDEVHTPEYSSEEEYFTGEEPIWENAEEFLFESDQISQENLKKREIFDLQDELKKPNESKQSSPISKITDFFKKLFPGTPKVFSVRKMDIVQKNEALIVKPVKTDDIFTRLFYSIVGRKKKTAQEKYIEAGKEAFDKEMNDLINNFSISKIKSNQEVDKIQEQLEDQAREIANSITEFANSNKSVEAKFGVNSPVIRRVEIGYNAEQIEFMLMGKLMDKFHGKKVGPYNIDYFLLGAFVSKKVAVSQECNTLLWELDKSDEKVVEDALIAGFKELDIQNKLKKYTKHPKTLDKYLKDFTLYSVNGGNANYYDTIHSNGSRKKSKINPAYMMSQVLVKGQPSIQEKQKGLMQGKYKAILGQIEEIERSVENIQQLDQPAIQKVKALNALNQRNEKLIKKNDKIIDKQYKIRKLEKNLEDHSKGSEQATKDLNKFKEVQRSLNQVYNAFHSSPYFVGSSYAQRFESYLDSKGDIKNEHRHDFIRAVDGFVNEVEKINWRLVKRYCGDYDIEGFHEVVVMIRKIQDFQSVNIENLTGIKEILLPFFGKGSIENNGFAAEIKVQKGIIDQYVSLLNNEIKWRENKKAKLKGKIKAAEESLKKEVAAFLLRIKIYPKLMQRV